MNVLTMQGDSLQDKFSNALIALQDAGGTGGVIVFPPGIYDLSGGGLVIPQRTGLQTLVLSCYGAKFVTSADNVTLLRRAYPLDMDDFGGITSERITVRGGSFAGNGGMGQVGIDIAASNRCAYVDCEFHRLAVAAIQTACVGGLVERCVATLCTQDGFIQRSGWGEGEPLWTGATTANSAGNHSTIRECRVYNAQGARSGYRVLANNSCRIVDCISEGYHPQYSVYYDNQGHTSGRMFTLDNFHNENLPTGAAVRVVTDGRVVIDRFQQRKSGATVLIDASGSNTTTAMIVVRDMPDSGAGQVFRAGGRCWWFERFGPGDGRDITQVDYWREGQLPYRLRAVNP